MTAQAKPLKITVPNKKIAIQHLENVARDAKIRARGLLENITFLNAHIDGLPNEYQGMNGIEMLTATADLMQWLQITLENMAKAERDGKLDS